MALGLPPSDWGYIGGAGYYQNQQSALQNVASHQLYGGLLGGMNVSNPYTNLDLVNQMAQQYYPQQAISSSQATIQSLFHGVGQAPAIVKKKAKRLIERLREEISEWHGDVLCRAS